MRNYIPLFFVDVINNPCRKLITYLVDLSSDIWNLCYEYICNNIWDIISMPNIDAFFLCIFILFYRLSYFILFYVIGGGGGCGVLRIYLK